jgi:hypothetical protein
MLDGNFPGIRNGSEINFTVPVDQFGGMGGKQGCVAFIYDNAQFSGTVNDDALPFLGTNFH